jgi:hypothetical protein
MVTKRKQPTKPAIKRKPGRPSTYDHKKMQAICDRVAAGEMLPAICDELGIRLQTLSEWSATRPQFSAIYTRAKEARLLRWAEEAVAISDTPQEGEKTEKTEKGRICSECDRDVKWMGSCWKHSVDKTELCAGGRAEVSYESKIVTADMIEHRKLRVETRKWMLARLARHVYGDKVQQEISGPDGAPISAELTIRDLTRDTKRPDGSTAPAPTD